MKNLISSLLVLTVLAFSCLSCTNLHCMYTNAYLVMAGYDSSELTNVTLAKFEKGTNFQEKVAEIGLSTSNNSIDSLDFEVHGVLDFNFDYTVKIGDQGRVYKIKNMEMSRLHAPRRGRDVCYDEVTSYDLDDVRYVTGLDGSVTYDGSYGIQAKIELKK